jgi:hypothetical protein
MEERCGGAGDGDGERTCHVASHGGVGDGRGHVDDSKATADSQRKGTPSTNAIACIPQAGTGETTERARNELKGVHNDQLTTTQRQVRTLHLVVVQGDVGQHEGSVGDRCTLHA